jgi:hypothetical protein
MNGESLRMCLFGGITATSVLAQQKPKDSSQEIESLKEQIYQLKARLEESKASDSQTVKVEDIQGILADLENFKYQVQKERERTALPTRPLNISGLIQARFGINEQEVDSPTVDDRKSTFEIGASILGFRGSLYRDYEEGRHLNYTLSSLASGGGSGGAFSLLDAHINYAILPTLSPDTARLNITWGQQQIPFGLEVQASEELKPVISNALFSSRLDLNPRQNGAILRGDLFPSVDFGFNYRVPLIEYAFGIVNGNGPNAPDNNNHKDVVARLAFAIPSDFNSWIRQIIIGTSLYRGQQNKIVASTVVGQGRKDRRGIDLSYNHHPVGITYEVVEGQDGEAAGTQTTDYRDIKRNSKGQTATFFYNFGEQFVKGYRSQARYDDWWPQSYQPFYRHDTFDPDRSNDNDSETVDTVGLNIFFAETTKLQFNLNNRKKAAAVPSREFLAQAQFGF